jgi:hypothetical protein
MGIKQGIGTLGGWATEFSSTSKKVRKLVEAEVLEELCQLAMREIARLRPGTDVLAEWRDDKGERHEASGGKAGSYLYHDEGGKETWADIYVDAWCDANLVAHVSVLANGTSFMSLAREVSDCLSKEGAQSHSGLRDWFQRRDDDVAWTSGCGGLEPLNKAFNDMEKSTSEDDKIEF